MFIEMLRQDVSLGLAVGFCYSIARHCEARTNLILLVICMLRLIHFVGNYEKPFVRVDSYLKFYL